MSSYGDVAAAGPALLSNHFRESGAWLKACEALLLPTNSVVKSGSASGPGAKRSVHGSWARALATDTLLSITSGPALPDARDHRATNILRRSNDGGWTCIPTEITIRWQSIPNHGRPQLYDRRDSAIMIGRPVTRLPRHQCHPLDTQHHHAQHADCCLVQSVCMTHTCQHFPLKVKMMPIILSASITEDITRPSSTISTTPTPTHTHQRH